MWGHSTLFSSSIIYGSPDWLTNFHCFISIHHCFHSKENCHYTILHYTCSYKFFRAFIDPILLHVVTCQGIFFVIVIIFLIALLLLMGIRFSSSSMFIFYIVFSFSFCLLQTFVIRGNYLIEKKRQCHPSSPNASLIVCLLCQEIAQRQRCNCLTKWVQLNILEEQILLYRL